MWPFRKYEYKKQHPILNEDQELIGMITIEATKKSHVDFYFNKVTAKDPTAPPKNWKYIGKDQVNITNDNSVCGKVIINYYMTDDGHRKVEFVSANSDHRRQVMKSQHGTEPLAWEIGGPFPKGFDPVDDVLGDMLTRLVDRKIKGEA